MGLIIVFPMAYRARKDFYVMFLVSFLTGILRSFVLLFLSFSFFKGLVVFLSKG